MTRNYFIYKISRPENTNDLRCYYGISHFSKTNGPKTRFNQHKKSNYPVGCFVRKYNDANLIIIQDNLTKNEAKEIEAILVPESKIEREKLNLLNLCGGGNIPPAFSDLSIEQQELLRIKRKNYATGKKYPCGVENKRSKPYKLIAPDGIVHEGISAIVLCREYNLSHPSIYRVLSGKIINHRGWRKG